MIGLALCGGGMKCAAHLGVLQVLEELGVRPALIAGSSMGAVVGAMYAAGLDPKRAAEELCRITMSDVFVGGFPLPGLNHARRLKALLLRVFGNRRIEDLRTPLIITTCDLVAGAPVWIDRGRLVDALYASCAIPVLFPPVVRGEQILVDGCLAEPLPVSQLRERGAQKVIGVSFLPVHRARRLSGSLPMRTLEVVQRSLSWMATRELDLAVQPVLEPRSGLWWNRRLLESYIEAGRTAASRVRGELDQLLCEVGLA